MDSQTTDEEFKHNVALAKNIVSVVFSVSLSTITQGFKER
jgi:hypothetical protein